MEQKLFKELYKNRNTINDKCSVIGDIPFWTTFYEASLEDFKEKFKEINSESLEDYFEQVNRVNRSNKNKSDYYIKLVENDCLELRKSFILERLKEADTRNRIVCLLALNSKKNSFKILKFLQLLNASGEWSKSTWIQDINTSEVFVLDRIRNSAFQEVQDIRDIEELKQYVINKIEK